MENFYNRPSVGPFMYCSRDETKTLANGEKYRLVIYGAYNALGLIGTEKNGIAILDENKQAVLCDGITSAASGYDTPTREQKISFDHWMMMTDETFRMHVNDLPNLRFKI